MAEDFDVEAMLEAPYKKHVSTQINYIINFYWTFKIYLYNFFQYYIIIFHNMSNSYIEKKKQFL